MYLEILILDVELITVHIKARVEWCLFKVSICVQINILLDMMQKLNTFNGHVTPSTSVKHSTLQSQLRH